MSFAEFIHMSGYAKFVWGAYGVALLVLVLNFAFAIRKLNRARKKLSSHRPENTKVTKNIRFEATLNLGRQREKSEEQVQDKGQLSEFGTVIAESRVLGYNWTVVFS